MLTYISVNGGICVKYSFNERKKFISEYFSLGTKICDCCGKKVSLQPMWKVKRFNENKSFDSWYYCKNCFVDKDEVLLEIDSDSYPYGIYPIDYNLVKRNNSWCISQTSCHRGDEKPYQHSNISRKKVKN